MKGGRSCLLYVAVEEIIITMCNIYTKLSQSAIPEVSKSLKLPKTRQKLLTKYSVIVVSIIGGVERKLFSLYEMVEWLHMESLISVYFLF